MKRLFIGFCVALAATSAFAQGGVIRGEAAPGSYVNINTIGPPTDAVTNNINALFTGSYNFTYNGTTWDRWRSSTLTGGAGIAKVTIAGVGDPCLSSEVPKSSTVINIAAAATTALVAPSASTIVYACDFTLTISQVVTTANTLQFVQGTGAACVTGQTALSGLFGAGGVTAGIPITISATSSGTVFKTSAAGGLCAVTAIGGSGSFQGVLTFVQQ